MIPGIEMIDRENALEEKKLMLRTVVLRHFIFVHALVSRNNDDPLNERAES